MSTDATTAAPQGTAATTAAPIAPAAPVPPVVATPAGEPKVEMTPAQLKARLDEERDKAAKAAEEKFAKDLGISLADAKKLIADAKAKDDAQKSEVQKLTEALAAERARLAEFESNKAIVEGRASIEFAALTEAQRAAVQSIAGDDAAKRLKTIDALKPTWVAAQQQAEAAQAAAVLAAKEAADKAAAEAAKVAAEAKRTAPIPAPASTTPAATPPAPAAPGQPTNHLAVWESLRVSNPAAAAMYRNKHDAAIRAAQKQATG